MSIIPNPTATGTARKPAKTTSDPKQTSPTVPNLPLDQGSISIPTSRVVQETASNSHPLPYWTDNAARFAALDREAEATVSMNFLGSNMIAGGKLTRKTTATTTIVENMNNASFAAGQAITELREAPNVQVAHEKVTNKSLGDFTSRTIATAGNATLNMTNTVTRASANVVIDQQATNTLNINERNVKIFSQNDIDDTRHAKTVNHLVDGRKKPANNLNAKSNWK